MMTPASVDDYIEQMKQSLATYQQRVEQGLIPPAQRLHVNFMARGEPLHNPAMLNTSQHLFAKLEQEAKNIQHDLDVHFLVSSILPNTFDGRLEDILAHPQSYLYYSLYSLNPAFRKRWLPKALDPRHGLDLCAQYQQKTQQRITLHWAFIANQNDHLDDVEAMLEAVQERGLKAKFNLVRYNPHDVRHGQETQEDKLHEIFDLIKKRLGDEESRIVPRVGFDVKASCGMFVGEKR